jgi:hypothetical protein
MHASVERVVPIKREQQLALPGKEVEIEVLMNMELVMSRSRPKWKFLPS